MGFWRSKNPSVLDTIATTASWRITEHPDSQVGVPTHPDEDVTAISEPAAVVAYARRHNLQIHGEPSWGNPWYLLATQNTEETRRVKAKRA